MKAAIYRENGEPAVLEYRDVPDPVAGPGHILVAVEAISIEGGDLLHRRFLRPASVPHVVGYAAAGTIAAVGPGVAGFSIGQRVTTFGSEGSHAALRRVRADLAWHVPDGVDIIDAAAVPVTFGTADDALFKLGNLQAGQSVLVQGATGAVGWAAIQLAHMAGARVFGTVSSERHVGRLAELGMQHAIDRNSDVAAEVRALNEGAGVDLVIDTIGGAALQQGVNALADGGRLVMVGMIDRQPHVVNASALLRTRKHLIGCMWGQVAHLPEMREAMDGLLARVAQGQLQVVIDRSFPLASAAEAHARAEQRGRIGRVIMLP